MQEVLKSTIYFPLLVSNKGTDEPLSKEEDALVWKKYLTISPENRAIITSYELPRKIKELQGKFNLNDTTTGQISLCIRKIFFGEIDIASFETTLRSLFADSPDNQSHIRQIVEYVNTEILHLVPKISPDSEESSVVKNSSEPVVKKLSILKAITEYPKLNDQLLTNEKIKVKGQSEPQRPSLAHWIRYYRDELGVGFHDQVLRGRFLFQSENGKRLSNEERERINLVLKSIEEDFPLDIDVEQGMVIFPTRPKNLAPATATTARPLFPPKENGMPARTVKPYVPAAPVSPASGVVAASPVTPPSKPSFFASKLSPAKNVAGETLHFSTGHVLPGEKAASPPDTGVQSAPTPAPVTPTAPLPLTARPAGINQNRGAALPRSPYSIRPLRLRDDINVKEE